MFRKSSRLLVALSAALAMALNADFAAAGVDGDLRAALYTDEESVGVGAGLLTGVGGSRHWFFNPNVEAAFDDEENLVTVNGDVHYDFAHTDDVTFWLGGGPALVHTDPERGDSETDPGLNLLTGLGDMDGAVRPYAQLRGLISEENVLVLAGGIRF
jgi:hypothetical protein